MESLHKLETTMVEWFKNAPHLPKGGQTWIANNVWWIAIIGAVVGAFALFALIPLAMLAFGLSATSGLANPYAYGPMYAPYGVPALAWLSVLISVVSLLAITVITAMAISPLKDHKKKGWDLLFLTFAINVVTAVLTVITFDFSGILSSIIGLIITAYLLFEIRGYFLEGKAKTAEEPKKAVKTEEKEDTAEAAAKEEK